MHLPRTASGRAALLLLPLLGCRGPGSDQAEAPPPPTLAEEAVARIQAGDVAGARALLDRMLVEDHLEEARTLLAEGMPEDALLALDRLLEIAPEDREVRTAKGLASLALAEKGIAEGGSALVVEGSLADAAAYLEGAEDPAARLGAGRAAWLLGDLESALPQVRAGLEARGTEALEPELRTAAEVLFAAYAAAKPDETRAEEAAELFDATEDVLGRLLGRAGDDPWPWAKLSDLYEWEERLEDARAALGRGLDRAPADSGLIERLARVARKQGGSVAAAQALEEFNRRHGASALGLWYEGKERFEHALVGLNAGERLLGEFQRAEELFRRCRAETEAYAEACKGYEVMCRAGIGWCHYHEQRLEEARAAFLSMDEVVERGLEWQIEGRLPSGIVGLQYVGAGYNDREEWAAAGEVFEILRTAQPEEPLWANNAGFFFRDAGVEQEFLGRRLCHAAAGDLRPEALAELRAIAGIAPEEAGTPRERELLARASNEAMRTARELLERSRAAYFDAARLAPDDVRVVNDAALVLVHYLHTDLDRAEELLRRCVELGEQQLAAGDLDEEATWELKNAWGDAFENLGVLHARHRGDLAGAIPYFERALEIGPDPRPVITDFWLPYARGERAADDLVLRKEWAEPCGEGAR